MKSVSRLGSLLVLFFMAFVLGSCSGSQEIIVQGAEATFQRGVQLLQKKSYVNARSEFDIVVKQYPASVYADSAQYYLAETYYNMEEYITAAFEFKNVYDNYPSSKLAPDARFKIAQCYAAQSPRPQLDQEPTRKAIQAFQDFIDYYPYSNLVGAAEKEIVVLRNKLAKKDYEIAELYKTLGFYRAAIVYYDVILDNYHDSNVADLAAIGKVKALLKRHRKSEAKTALKNFYATFPDSPARNEANKLARTLNLDINKLSNVN